MWPESAKPKTLVLGLGPVITFFRVKTKDFAPFFFAYSESGDNFGLTTWGSDWCEA